MAWCPFAVHQPIPETHSQGRITPTTLIYHEAVSWADSLYGYWTSGGVELESHFYIGQSGALYQFVDTAVRADANYHANPFAVSVETWDAGGDVNLAWNPEMLATAARLAAWLCETHPTIPKRAATSWNGGGIGGHNWFPAEWAGGPRACPGPNRSAQIRNDIIPHVAQGGGWQEDDDMPSIREIEDAAYSAVLNAINDSRHRANDRAAAARDSLGAIVWGHPLENPEGGDGGSPKAAGVILGWSDAREAHGIRAIVSALSGTGGVDVDVLAGKLREALGDSIADELAARLANKGGN